MAGECSMWFLTCVCFNKQLLQKYRHLYSGRGECVTVCLLGKHAPHTLTLCRPPHLKRVLGHAGEAVIGGAGGDGANAELADLVCLTELRDAFWFHHTHQAWVDDREVGGKVNGCYTNAVNTFKYEIHRVSVNAFLF